MQPKVIVLTTGGTIAHRTNAMGVAELAFDPARIAGSGGAPDAALEFRAVLRKGSMDVVPDDWVTIARAVAEAVADRPAGIVVLHGTDTMHYTAAALSFMVQGLGIPVVLTGSMIPGGDTGSDAAANMSDAIRVAAEADLAGVLVVFSADAARSRGVIIHGCRARKTHSHAIDAITSVNAAPVGFVDRGRIALTETGRAACPARGSRPLRLGSVLERNVALVKLTPAVTADMLQRILDGLEGVVLEGTGVGHIRTELQPVIAQFGKPAVVTTQSLNGGEKLGTYDVDAKILAIPNVIATGDMNSDTALIKLMWCLGQGGDTKRLMRANMVSEITSVG